MLTQQEFNSTMKGLYSLLPFAKALPAEAVMLAWLSFPAKAKAELNTAMLSYAAGQLLQDPAPDKEKPPHLALLRYLYRFENGQPNYEWGLKLDLPQRMAADGQFFPEPISQAHLAATGELPDYDGPRHSPNGVLARLEQAFDDS